jgi:cobyrinic acid a,c-diamide synthase
MTARGLIIAAPHSGAGKTTVTLAILAALTRRGLTVRAAKAGPDYIDPAFHAAAIGAPSVNLDSWAMPDPLLDTLAAESTDGADILVIEGVMGLFDGAPGTTGRRGATAELAAHFRLPVVLVLDVSRQAQSASERHRALVADAIEALGIPVLGAVPREAELTLPERHLGLVQAGEHADLAALISRLAAMAQSHIDLNAILISGTALPTVIARTNASAALPPPGQRVALASDRAFSFVYPHLMSAWRSAGAEIIPFSPLANEPPPERADSCWLPGGYPELHVDKLAAAERFLSGLRHFAQTRPVHGECGGYMALGQSLEDASGHMHAMAGLLGHATSFAKRKLHLGYRSARLLGDGVLGAKGASVRGHEFHYATLTAAGSDETLAEMHDGEGKPLGKAGGRRGNVSGTFFHAIAAAD